MRIRHLEKRRVIEMSCNERCRDYGRIIAPVALFTSLHSCQEDSCRSCVAEGIDNGKARPKAEAVLLILSGEPDSSPKAEKMVSLKPAGWNQITDWLKSVGSLVS